MKNIFAFIIMLTAVACTSDEKKPANECAKTCETAVNCGTAGLICQNKCCVESSICTQSECEAQNKFCDLDGFCKTPTERCDKPGCECHITNITGQYVAEGTSRLVLAGGQTSPLNLVLATNDGLVLTGATFDLTSSDTATVEIPSGTTSIKTTSASGTATVTAKVSGITANVTCSVAVENLGAASTLRILALDDQTGVGVSGIEFVVDCDGDGDGDSAVTATTPTGLYTATACSTPYAITAFKSGYNYLSVVNLSVTTTDIVLPLSARASPALASGFDGNVDFSSYETNFLEGDHKQIKFGIVSSSFPIASALNFDLSLFLGSSFTDVTAKDCEDNPSLPGCYPVKIGNFINKNLPLPGGVLISVGNIDIKDHFDAQGPEGRRYAFSLSGELDFGDIGDVVTEFTSLFGAKCDCNTTAACDKTSGTDAICSCDSDCGINFDAVNKALTVLLPNLASGVTGNLPLKQSNTKELKDYFAKPYGSRFETTGKYPRLDSGDYPGKTSFRSISLKESLKVPVDAQVPNLPADKLCKDLNDLGTNKCSPNFDALFAIAGVNAPGFGIVPTGLGIAADCSGSNCLDYAADPSRFNGSVNKLEVGSKTYAPDGHMAVFKAKEHSGLQGQPPITVLVATNFSAVGQNFGTRVTGAVVHDSVTATNLSGKTFLEFPKFLNGQASSCGRDIAIVGATGVDAHWLTVASEEDVNGSTTRWNIWVANPGTDVAVHFVAPVPTGLADPMTPATSDNTIDLTHIAWNLQSGTSFEDLVANKGKGTLSELPDKVDAFNLRSRYVPWTALCP